MPSTDALESDAVVAFAVFADHANFTTAAAQLHLSQPALHVKIAKLAAALDVPLYERVGRGLRITSAGEAVAAYGRDQRARAQELLGELCGVAQPITVAAGRGAFQWVLGDGLRALAGDGRGIRVQVANRQGALDAVQSGRADVGVVGFDPPPAGLRQRQLRDDPHVLLLPAGHPLRRRRRLRVGELDGIELVAPPTGRPHRLTLERAREHAGITWRVVAEADGWDLQAHFVSVGLGAAVVNGCVPAPPGTIAVPVVDLPRVGYWAVWRPGRGPRVDQAAATLARAARAEPAARAAP